MDFKTITQILLQDAEFFKSYRDKFESNFFKHLKGNGSGVFGSDSLKTLVGRLYLLLFSFSRDPYRELSDLFYRLASHDLDIRAVFSKTLLEMLRDYIDFSLEKDGGHERVKAFIELIDYYISAVEEAYSKYLKELRSKAKDSDRSKVEGEVGLIIEFFERQVDLGKRNLEIITFYKEVPIICRSKILDIDNRTLTVKLCELRAFKEGEEVYLKHLNLPKTVAATVLEVNNRDETMEVEVVGFIDLPQERRRYVRVVPKDPIEIKLFKGSWVGRGIIADISVGGVGVYIKDIGPLSEGDTVDVEFRLPKGLVRVSSQVRHIEHQGDLYRLGLSYELDIKKEEIVSDYVMERQFEILKELKGS